MTPPVARLMLLCIAIGSLVGALAAPEPSDPSGNWSVGATHSGSVAPDEPRAHALDVALPAAWETGGVRVEPARAEISLRAAGAIDAKPFRVEILDADGALALDARLDPANPFSSPHGPPSAAVGPGAYTLRVSALGGEPTEYAFSAVLILPFSAGATGLVVPLVLPWGLAALALAGALFPLPRFARSQTEVTTQ